MPRIALPAVVLGFLVAFGPFVHSLVGGLITGHDVALNPTFAKVCFLGGLFLVAAGVIAELVRPTQTSWKPTWSRYGLGFGAGVAGFILAIAPLQALGLPFPLALLLGGAAALGAGIWIASARGRPPLPAADRVLTMAMTVSGFVLTGGFWLAAALTGMEG